MAKVKADCRETDMTKQYVPIIRLKAFNRLEHSLHIPFIAGSAKRSTYPLSILLTKMLTHIKQGL